MTTWAHATDKSGYPDFRLFQLDSAHYRFVAREEQQ